MTVFSLKKRMNEWTIMVYINYRIVEQAGYQMLECIYRTFPFHRTPLQFNNRCTVSRPTMTRVHIRRELRLDNAGAVCQFDHVEMRQIVDGTASPKVIDLKQTAH